MLLRNTILTSLLTVVAFATLAACGPSQKAPEATTKPAGNPGDATTANDNNSDAPVSNDTTPAADGCAKEIAIKCASPYVDGCSVAHPTDASRKLTTEHRCVSPKPSATPCEAEIALECGEGAQDSCLVDPPAGDVHFCVPI